MRVGWEGQGGEGLRGWNGEQTSSIRMAIFLETSPTRTWIAFSRIGEEDWGPGAYHFRDDAGLLSLLGSVSAVKGFLICCRWMLRPYESLRNRRGVDRPSMLLCEDGIRFAPRR